MKPLHEQQCLPVTSAVPALTEAEVDRLRSEILAWEIFEEGGAKQLRRTFRLTNFASALELTNHIGAVAEMQAHYPVLITHWGQVTVIWRTPDTRGLHRNDFIMAARTDALYREWMGIKSQIDDVVEEASKESFPASDAPAWT